MYSQLRLVRIHPAGRDWSVQMLLTLVFITLDVFAGGENYL